MLQIEKFKTFDGLEHESFKKAIIHLDNIQGNLCSKHAHKLASIDKYVNILKYLLDNFKDFEVAIKASKDINIDNYCEIEKP